MFSLGLSAIVVVSPPPPPATANQQNCDYSVRVETDTYKCYSSAEYNVIQQQEKQKNDELNAMILDFICKYWWALAIVFIATFVIYAYKSADDIEYLG